MKILIVSDSRGAILRAVVQDSDAEEKRASAFPTSEFIQAQSGTVMEGKFISLNGKSELIDSVQPRLGRRARI